MLNKKGPRKSESQVARAIKNVIRVGIGRVSLDRSAFERSLTASMPPSPVAFSRQRRWRCGKWYHGKVQETPLRCWNAIDSRFGRPNKVGFAHQFDDDGRNRRGYLISATGTYLS